MASTAATLLANGFAVNLTVHGESLSYIPASAVVKSETGEAITNETADAILSDDTATAITGIFDDAYVTATFPGGSEVSSIDIAVVVKASDVSGIERGAIIIRDEDDVSYYVQKIMSPEVDGSQVLILSKDAQ